MKTLLSLLALLPIALFAQSTAWYTANPDADVFEISTLADLHGLTSLVNSPIPVIFSGKTIKLKNNINMAEINFPPIGNNSTTNSFRGTFDGQGYTISGLLIDGNYKSVGLFGYVGENGKIKDVNVIASKIKITTTLNYDSLFAGGLAGYYNSTQAIENCSVKADSITVAAESTKLSSSGGLIGYVSGKTDSVSLGNNNYAYYLNNFVISNSYAIGNILGYYSGGLVGYISNSNITISNSHTEGNILNKSKSEIAYYSSGGLIGRNYSSGSISILNSYSTADVVGPYSGGLLGQEYNNNSSISIWDSYTTGKISGVYSGGLVGKGNPYIENSYSTGDVGGTEVTNADSHSGGLVGKGNPYIENSYSTGNISASTIGDIANGSSNSYYSRSGGLVGSGSGFIVNSYASGNILALIKSSGYVMSNQMAYSGGLVGDGSGSIENSYASGDVSAKGIGNYTIVRSGGLIGVQGSSASIENGYVGGKVSASVSSTTTSKAYLNDTLGTVYHNSGKAYLTKETLKYKYFFSGWDFNNIWSIDEETSYPYLKNNVPSKIPGSDTPKGDFSLTWYANDTNAAIFYLSTERDLRGFAFLTKSGKSFSGKTVALARDIDFIDLGGINFTSIGLFRGIFDGKGFTISGLVADGLFGSVGPGGQIKNVNIIYSRFVAKAALTNANVTTGGLAAGYGSTQAIENCSVIVMAESSIFAASSNTAYSGGLIGDAYGDTVNIVNSYVNANIYAMHTGSGSGTRAYSGGLIGYHNSSTVLNIRNSYASGEVDASSTGGTAVAGGILGGYYYTGASSFTSVYYNSEKASKAAGTICNSGNTCGDAIISGISGKSSFDLKKQATFIGWNFSDIWGIDEAASYPYLKAFPQSGSSSSSEHPSSSSSGFIVSRNITIAMKGLYDSWNGAMLRISINGIRLSPNATVSSGGSGTYTFNANLGDVVAFRWVKGNNDIRCSFDVYYTDNPSSILLYKNGVNVSTGTLLGSFTVSANSGSSSSSTPSSSSIIVSSSSSVPGSSSSVPSSSSSVSSSSSIVPRNITVVMRDSYPDGWNGAALRISINGTNLSPNATLSSGGSGIYTFNANPGDAVAFYWIKGSYDDECAFAVYYTNNPPSPAFNPATNASNDDIRILFSKQYTNSGYLSTGTLLILFTVPPNSNSSSSSSTSSSSSSIGSSSSVSSSSIPSSGNSFTDSRDGKTYKYVTIGSQVWMAENLNYNASGSKCYNDNSTNCTTYGRLYDWSTAMTACPSGWHLPTQAEWNVLTEYVGGASTEGKYLKTASGWNSYNGQSGNGINAYGFAALPGGLSNSAIIFSGVGDFGYWWSASEFDASEAYYQIMTYINDYVVWDHFNKNSLLYSVRCLRDIGSSQSSSSSIVSSSSVSSSSSSSVYSSSSKGSSSSVSSNPAEVCRPTLAEIQNACPGTTSFYQNSGKWCVIDSCYPSSSSSIVSSSSSSSSSAYPSSSSGGSTPSHSPQIASGNIRVHTTSNAIVLENLPANARVEVYSLQGKLVNSAYPENPQILRIGVQTKGVYVVKADSQIMRVAVR